MYGCDVKTGYNKSLDFLVDRHRGDKKCLSGKPRVVVSAAFTNNYIHVLM